MGLLDADFESQAQDWAKWELDRQRRQTIILHSARLYDSVRTLQHMHDWIYKHWAERKEDFFQRTKIEHIMRCSQRTRDYAKRHCEYVLDQKINIPTHYSTCIGIVDEPQKISEVMAFPQSTIIRISLPQFDLFCSPSYDINDVSCVVRWSKCDLFLTDITQFPDYLGHFTEDGVFNWKIPIDNLYITNSPNIDERILKLPYVKVIP